MEDLNLSLPLIILTLLTSHCTTFSLFLNHRCYFQNISYTKTFPNWTFEKCIKSSIFLYLFFYIILYLLIFIFFIIYFWNPSQIAFTYSKRWKQEFLKYVKYAWKSIHKIWSTTKTQERLEWCCSGVFINNFRGVGIEDPVEHLR